MNKILSELVKEKLDEINYTSEFTIRFKMVTILEDIFGIKPEKINTIHDSWTGDIEVIFQLLNIKSGRTYEETQIPIGSTGVFPITDKVEILYSDNKNNCRLDFDPNNDSTYKIMFSQRGQDINNFYYQRNLLKLISTIVYMKDRKMRGYTWLPEFEEDIRDLLNYYEIYPKNIEPFDKLI